MTKVSIIIPVYNSEKYIKKCIDSILNNTYKDIEIIAIDDGSKDNSLNILKEISEINSNVFVYSQKNMGVAKTRNKGIKLATGKYIMFIDNDDFIDKDYIETFVKIAEENNSDIVFGGFRRPNNDGKIMESVKLIDSEWSKYKIMALWAKIFNRQFILNNHIEILPNNIGEDVYFMVKAINLTNKIYITDYIGYNWFYNDDSVSNTLHKYMGENIKFEYLLNKTYEELKKNKVDLFNEYLEYFFIKQICWYFFYSCKGVSKNILYSEYDKYFKWLKEHFPNYKKNKYIKLFSSLSESFNVKIAVLLAIKLDSIHLGKLFFNIYKKI